MIIDTHCHLNSKQFLTDVKEVISDAKRSGIAKIIVPGTDKASSDKSLMLSETFRNTIYPAVGFHPYEAQKTDPDGVITYLNRIIRTHKICAVGECGLDYHLYKGHAAQSKKDNQKFLFEAHLRLALKFDLPAIIHCRDAYDDLFTVLDNLPVMPRGVIHCFSGGNLQLRMAIQRKLYIGIDGNVTYDKNIIRMIPSIPVSSMLIETDSPLLTPVPLRGTRNEPKNIRLIASAVSKIIRIPFERFKDETSSNAIRLFSLDDFK